MPLTNVNISLKILIVKKRKKKKEEGLLLSSLKQPLSWFRFIDDVDMKWIHSDKELDAFF